MSKADEEVPALKKRIARLEEDIRTLRGQQERQGSFEQELDRSETRYRQLFNSIDEGFCVIEVIFDAGGKARDYRFLEANEAFDRQTGLQNAVGKTIREMAPQHEEHWFEIYGRVALTGESIRFENRAEQLGFYYDVYAFRLDDPQANRVGILFKDISERVQAHEQLKEADRRKDEFLAMLAHELRNPLAAITNIVRLLTLTRTDDKDLAPKLQILTRQSNSLGTLVEQLLDVSRISRGLIDIVKQDVDLCALLVNALEVVRPQALKRQQDLRLSVPDIAVNVQGDPVRLEQVVVNLLTNAVRYTQNGGEISVCLQVRGCFAELIVVDNGIGIGDGMREKIFDLFTQGERSVARTEGGLGVGLTIVKKLVGLHGGTVKVESEGPGKGSRFIVSFPLAPAAGLEERGNASEAHRSRSVLLVDDNKDGAESMALLLRCLGHQVTVAYDGPGALNQIKSMVPEVVLLDIGMPDMDGYELATILRQQEETRNVRVAALTGYNREGNWHSETSAFDAHFVKPVDLDTLRTFMNQDIKDRQQPRQRQVSR